jgi:hypothetical protein
MLKNSLSLNRLANVFYVLKNEMIGYSELKEGRLEKLQHILRIINIAIKVLEMKVHLKGISKEFVQEAKLIKNKA